LIEYGVLGRAALAGDRMGAVVSEDVARRDHG
jgi:hypothetical protein